MKKISSKELPDLARFLRVISDKHRLKIIHLLRKGEKCVCEIEEVLGLPQNLTSHHLKVLLEADVLGKRREGNRIYYFLNSKDIDKKIKVLNKLLTQ